MQSHTGAAVPKADAVFVLDADGRIIEWDEQVAELLGWSADEMLGTSIVDLLPEWRAHTVLRARVIGAANRLPALCASQNLHLWLGRRSATGKDIEMRVVESVLVPDTYLVLLRVLVPVAKTGRASALARRLAATVPPRLADTLA